jgi:hypothetical protein
VQYNPVLFNGETMAIADQAEPECVVTRGAAAHFAHATNHLGGFGMCG